LDGGTAVEVRTDGLRVCGPPQPVELEVQASDGLYTHTETATVTVSPGRPGVVPASATVPAGGPPLHLTVDAGTFAACEPRAYGWTLTGQGMLVTDGGTEAQLIPPAHVCTAAGIQAIVQVEAIADGGTALADPVPVMLAPWGAPQPPFGPGATV